jgi:hypothetical protein
VANESLTVPGRLWLAITHFFRVLFDSAFAASAARLAESTPDLATQVADSPSRMVSPTPSPAARPNYDVALGLLALFQREGRLIDFLEQDIDVFPDAEIGAAARVVHGGCRRALRAHFGLVRVRPEAEGATVTVLAGEAREVKLTGNVQGSAPYRGVLRHAGWRAEHARLPEMMAGHDASIIGEAEVEV